MNVRPVYLSELLIFCLVRVYVKDLDVPDNKTKRVRDWFLG